MKGRITLTIMLGMLTMFSAIAQVAGDFRTSQAGTWNNSSTWEIFDGKEWISAINGQFPHNSNKNVEIRHDVTLTEDAIVNGKMVLLDGNLSIGSNTLTIAGDFEFFDGSLLGGKTSHVVFEGKGDVIVVPAFEANRITMNRPNGVTLLGDTRVYDFVIVEQGKLFSHGHLILNSDASGTADIYTIDGEVEGDVTVERYIEKAGYHMISPPIWTGRILHINQQEPLIGLGGQYYDPQNLPNPFPNLWKYDETSLHPDSMRGWVTPVDLQEKLDPCRGYAMIFSQPNTTFKFVGGLNNGEHLSQVTYTEKSTPSPTAQGWNLIGNPFACTADWDAVEGWMKDNIENSVYYWNPVTNQYAVYVGSFDTIPGIGNNGATNLITSMSAFFVKAKPGGGDFSMDNRVRTQNKGAFFKQAPPSYAHLKISVNGMNNSDETVLRFIDGATEAYDVDLDAYKLRSIVPGVPSLYSKMANTMFAVNTMPAVSKFTVIPVYFEAGTNGQYSISISDVDVFGKGSLVYLKDIKNNELLDLRQRDTYSFTASVNDEAARFEIHIMPANEPAVTFTDRDLDAPAFDAIDKPFTAANNNGVTLWGDQNTIYIDFNYDEVKNAEVSVYNILGQNLISRVYPSAGRQSIPIKDPSENYYLVNIKRDGEVYTNKVRLNR